jgi:predicted MFS family arabinose efflux permease
MVRRAMVLVVVAGCLGTAAEALVVPYGAQAGVSQGLLGLLAATIPLGTVLGTTLVARSDDHHRLLRAAATCVAVAAAAAAPLFWLEASGPVAFVAFAIVGGMFALSVPANVVIGTRLRRDTRASAMGIAVGVLMGGQALGAAAGGAIAAWVGAPRTVAGALTIAAVFGAWAATTTPTEARHLRRRSAVARAEAAPEPDTLVIDLVALEAQGGAAARPVATVD